MFRWIVSAWAVGLLTGMVCPVGWADSGEENWEVMLEAALTEEEAGEAEAAKAERGPGEEAYWEALMALMDPAEAAQARGIAKLREAAELEFSPAQNLLGLCHLEGMHGVEKSPRRALNWFELAVEQGDRFAMVNLAGHLLDNPGVFRRRQNEERAQSLLETALAETGPWYAGLEVPESYYEAQHRREEAMEESRVALDGDEATMQERSEGIAAYRLARLHYDKGRFEEAHPYFVRAARIGFEGRRGVYPAAVQAALNHAFGTGVERDMVAARELLEHSKKLFRRRTQNYAVGLIDQGVIDRFALRDVEAKLDQASEEFGEKFQMQIARAFGDRRSKDFDAPEAILWYQLAAESGNVWAIINLAELYADPKLPVYDLAKAAHWWEYGYENARHALIIDNHAIALYRGIGREADPVRAAEVFEAFRLSQIGCYLGTLGKCPEAFLSYEKRLDLIKEWAEKHRDPTAQYFYGRHFYYGWGVEESNAAAFRWFTRAAESGVAEAHYYLGQIHRWGHGRRRDMEKALVHYQLASEGGSVSGAFQYAYQRSERAVGAAAEAEVRRLYERVLELDPEHFSALNNIGVLYSKEANRHPKSSEQRAQAIEQMLHYYKAGAEAGSQTSSLNLARLYLEGIMIPADYRQALRYANRAADQDERAAYFLLGRIYDEGLGVGRNIEEAAHSFDRLSMIYGRGLGVRQNLRRADRYFERALALEFSDALFTEAAAYREAGDHVTAVKKLEYARSKGSRDAAHMLGQYCLHGIVVAKDPARAVALWREAAEANQLDALVDLAVLVAQGAPEAPTLAEGIAFARRAEALGHPRAQAVREFLEKRLQEERRGGGGGGGQGLT